MSRLRLFSFSFSLPAAACVAACLASPAGAATGGGAATKVGVDQQAQVSFSVAGRQLTVTLRPVDGAPNPLLAELSAAPVVMACKGRGPKGGPKRIASATTTWAEGATAQSIRLPRDISTKPDWCVLERPDGTDLAVTTKLRTPKPT